MKFLDSEIRASEIVGIDIGGANLKLADASGESLSSYFPMWTEHSRLGACLLELLSELSGRTGRRYDRLALTMTGEMADCFASRREGVRRILDQIVAVLPSVETWVYGVDGAWLSPAEALQHPWIVAASNWHALANWILRSGQVRRENNLRLVVDIGSTTVDVIPVDSTGIATIAKTDRQRLQLGQLIYTGVGRSPVASIVSYVDLDGEICPVVAEKFATSDDAYLVLGLTRECESDCESADGRPRTMVCARARLARMIAEDLETLGAPAIESIARQIVAAQAERVAAAIVRNLDSIAGEMPAGILVAGHGRALAQEVQKRLMLPAQFCWLDELISPSAARCAPAVAVAWLLAQRVVTCQP